MQKETILNFNQVAKEYTDEVGFRIQLFEKVSFNVEKNKINSILAPTGAGKSTLLKIAAQLIAPTNGEIKYTDKIKPIYIPSEPSSFPWYNLTENLRIVSSTIAEEKVSDISKIVGLEGYEDHLPDNRSLGFRFRISIARALAAEANLIILDEPFSKMDSDTKLDIYTLIRKICNDQNITFLLGTTNISEAIFLSENIFLMQKDPGRIIDFIENNLHESRTPDIFTSSEFLKLRNQIEEKFQKDGQGNLHNFSI